ncbi:MAG: phosphate ABC transporter permease PstA [Crenarchaeota archaeon]|nr:phosphate ABC transporter permease PstA [Thermoproteota archaeon]MCR8454433.1 phosphate ABC transporter permease PstA [Thermoproteota archaeon]MCR8455659.1 phosphate ABC transporter permease PstA [Thermoproteota archaeon]MCR8462967.1 phosphate ABC transporter permease PstA [Thermoproteota archaeon]MCR8471285.1 phosphate ABC transporter permease PstA [Thermoproteota archaeon]
MKRLRNLIDKSYTALAACSFFILVLPLLHIIGSIIINGLKRFDLELITSPPKSLLSAGGGILHAIVGTAMVVFVAMIISLPIGFLTGIYLAEFARGKLAQIIRALITTIAGIPSIIVGVFAYTIIVVVYGFSVLAGGFALGFISIPYVVRSTEEALKAVPIEIKEAGFSLGIPRWKVILFIDVGYAKSRIIAGFLLALARVIGETAPLIVTILGGINIPSGLFSPANAIPLVIYQYALSPFKAWHDIAWSAALLLLIIALVMNLGVRYYLKIKAIYY